MDISIEEAEEIARYAFKHANPPGDYDSAEPTMKIQILGGIINIVIGMTDMGYRLSKPLKVVQGDK